MTILLYLMSMNRSSQIRSPCVLPRDDRSHAKQPAPFYSLGHHESKGCSIEDLLHAKSDVQDLSIAMLLLQCLRPTSTAIETTILQPKPKWSSFFGTDWQSSCHHCHTGLELAAVVVMADQVWAEHQFEVVHQASVERLRQRLPMPWRRWFHRTRTLLGLSSLPRSVGNSMPYGLLFLGQT